MVVSLLEALGKCSVHIKIRCVILHHYLERDFQGTNTNPSDPHKVGEGEGEDLEIQGLWC